MLIPERIASLTLVATAARLVNTEVKNEFTFLRRHLFRTGETKKEQAKKGGSPWSLF
jgi:hypothetical protein